LEVSKKQVEGGTAPKIKPAKIIPFLKEKFYRPPLINKILRACPPKADFRSRGWESAKRISVPPAEGRRDSQSASGFCW